MGNLQTTLSVHKWWKNQFIEFYQENKVADISVHNILVLRTDTPSLDRPTPFYKTDFLN